MFVEKRNGIEVDDAVIKTWFIFNLHGLIYSLV